MCGGQREVKMRSLLMLVVAALPQLISCDSVANNDNEKYTQPNMPQSSLYCNDLNPQMHLDFNMVIFALFSVRCRAITQLTFDSASPLSRCSPDIFNKELLSLSAES